MQKNKMLKGLLAVSAVAAMFSAVGVQAQTSVGSSPSQTGTSSTNPNQAGKTTKEGTMDNTNSTGMENRANQAGSKGMSGSTGATSSGQASGSASSAGMTGKTTRDGTMGNTNSQGMEHRSTGGSAAGQATAAGAATGAKLSSGDQKILKDIAMADMAEIEGGKLAQSKGQSSEVKAFGQQMIDDHTSNLNDVKALADARGVTLPTEPDAKHKAMAAKLEKMSGADFDKAYMKQAGVQDHKTVHGKLMTASKKAKDPEVKALVDKTEPVVAQHLKSAQQMPAPKAGTTAGK
jgi:predicted outer membrane protein